MPPSRRKKPVVTAIVIAITAVGFIALYVHNADRAAIALMDGEISRAAEFLRRGNSDVPQTIYRGMIDAPRRTIRDESAERARIDRARLELARILERRNDATAAAELLLQVVSESVVAEARKLLGRLESKKRLAEADELAARGLWWDAERLYRNHLDTTRQSLPSRLAFHRILIRQGRRQEARDVFAGGIFALDKPEDLLLSLWVMDTDTPAVSEWEASVASAAEAAPQDRRVKLARAFLARSAGRFDEAFAILSELAALKESNGENAPDPADAEREALLRLSLDSPSHFEQAMTMAFADELRHPLRLPRQEAEWAIAMLCRKQNRLADERKWLEQILTSNSSDRATLARLAEISKATGSAAEAARFETAKNEAENRRIEYTLLARKAAPPTADQANRLAALAKDLGLAFDAWSWGQVAAGQVLKSENAPAAETVSLADLAPELIEEWSRFERADIASTASTDAPVSQSGTLRFSDIADRSGLAEFVHINGGPSSQLTPPLSSSGGVAILDYDGDGLLDVFAVQSGAFPADPSKPHDGDKLFRNRGDGTFENVTARAGIDRFPRGFGHGVAVGDIDNDGHPDLFVTRWKSYALYRNRGDGTFEDATSAWGLAGDMDWPTSAAFADLDNDGDLDLYVCHYMEWIEGKSYPCIDPSKPNTYDCRPRDFPALQDRLYRNDGGRFTDVSADAGIAAIDTDGRGLGVVAVDVNDDRLVDLFVANDTTPNFLLINKGNLKFEDEALLNGVAANAQGGFQAGMGVAAADTDGDGLIDLAVTNFFNESTTIFRNLGGGLFADRTAVMGVAAPSRFLLGFGLVLVDFDNDGLTDYMTANGHVTDSRPAIPWRMPLQILQGTLARSNASQGGRTMPTGEFRFVDRSATAGEIFSKPLMARGLAYGDLDEDGLTDIVVQSQNDPLLHLRNESAPDPESGSGNGWLAIELQGVRSNRDGVGAKVTLISRVPSGEISMSTATRVGGGSFQSASSGRIHFGLGTAKPGARKAGKVVAEMIRVDWPSGQVDEVPNPPSDRLLILREGVGLVSRAKE